jgi:hypothetical protein
MLPRVLLLHLSNFDCLFAGTSVFCQLSLLFLLYLLLGGATTMKGSLILTFLYLFSTAWAGGYQGCLERVWLYQALVIDYEMNAPAARRIGVQCKPRDWDKTNKLCSNWQALVRHPIPSYQYLRAEKLAPKRQHSYAGVSRACTARMIF